MVAQLRAHRQRGGPRVEAHLVCGGQPGVIFHLRIKNAVRHAVEVDEVDPIFRLPAAHIAAQPSSKGRGGLGGNSAGMQMTVHPHPGHEIANIAQRLFAAGTKGESEHERPDFATATGLFHRSTNQLNEAAFAIFFQREITHALLFERH